MGLSNIDGSGDQGGATAISIRGGARVPEDGDEAGLTGDQRGGSRVEPTGNEGWRDEA